MEGRGGGERERRKEREREPCIHVGASHKTNCHIRDWGTCCRRGRSPSTRYSRDNSPQFQTQADIFVCHSSSSLHLSFYSSFLFFSLLFVK